METGAVLLNTESDKGVAPANEAQITVMTRLTFSCYFSCVMLLRITYY